VSREIGDDELAGLLGESGWSPSRRIDVADAVTGWVQRGYTASAAAREFVAEFDGITFTYPRHPLDGGTHTCVLDAVAATRSVAPARVREYQERTGEPLCPVGRAASGHVVLLVAASGRVYGGYDDFLARYGDNGRQALRNIYHRIDPVRLTRAD
jgi:hypothetical protein